MVTALPGDLGQGLLIDEPGGFLQFGPDPLSGGVTVDGVANAALVLEINGGDKVLVPAIIDSGGVYGTIPSSILTAGQVGEILPAGSQISVYTSAGQLLYSYTTTAANGPTISSGDTVNTGYMPFALEPVYINYSGAGSTTFH